jgi:hypothetical protein
MNNTDIDILSIMVILIDLCGAVFLIWRATHKKATLWGAARAIYVWVATLGLYHGIIYILSLFKDDPNSLITQYLHPFVILFVINPILIALIHWRGGRLWK